MTQERMSQGFNKNDAHDKQILEYYHKLQGTEQKEEVKKEPRPRTSVPIIVNSITI